MRQIWKFWQGTYLHSRHDGHSPDVSVLQVLFLLVCMHLCCFIPGLGHLDDTRVQQLVTLATFSMVNRESLQGLGGCLQGA